VPKCGNGIGYVGGTKRRKNWFGIDDEGLRRNALKTATPFYDGENKRKAKEKKRKEGRKREGCDH